jgi:hypothetical protein
MRAMISSHINDQMSCKPEWVHICAVPTTFPAAQPAGPCVGGPGGDISGFKVSVKGARWADRVMPAQYQNVPKAQLSMLGSSVYVLPQAEFMVISLSVMNNTNAPLAWSNLGRYQFTYNLVNPQGVKYEYSQQQSSIIIKTSLGNLNPGIPVEGEVVFDVPKGPYTFTITQQSLTAYGRYRNTLVFQCLLS